VSVDLSDYVEVPERIAEFREKHPEGSLQTRFVDVPEPFRGQFIAVEGRAYRSPDDPRPGIDIAWEPVPGKTPYTKDSEAQNASTSAVGRAIVYALAADTKRGIASANEVRNRQDADAEQPQAKPPADQATGPQKGAITRRCNELGVSDDHKPLLITWAGGMPLTKGKAGKLIDLLTKAQNFSDVWRMANLPNPAPEQKPDEKPGERTLEQAVEEDGAEALGLTEHDA
jgi:hypothetical protein